MQVRPDGPIPARILICGEAPGQEEERLGVPFVGGSGIELNRMLHEAGIQRSECFVTNVARIRPFDNDIKAFIPEVKKDIPPGWPTYRGRQVHPCIIEGAALLEKEIALVNPNLIIAFGNTALWALLGEWGITRLRGSTYIHPASGAIIVPTFHPAAILRQWDLRVTAIHDLRRAAKYINTKELLIPRWKFILQPSFAAARDTLGWLWKTCNGGPTWIELDLETKHGHIDCLGLSWSATEALCLPFLSNARTSGYWSADEESLLVFLLYQLLTHPNALVRGQNLLYDFQYIYRHWHFLPRLGQDTMISHHVAFAGLPKRLDYQASLYCEYYRQWKPEKAAWKEGG
jgi:uracil-DNA glycosylase family 4